MLRHRQTLCFPGILKICLVLMIASMSQGADDWTIVKIKNREYVTADNVAEFYEIDDLEKSGGNRVFRHPGLHMEWTIGSPQIFVNRIKFNLSLPITQSNGKALISTVDLAKLLDPIARPSYIKRSYVFDTVVIDPGHGGGDPGAKGIKGLEKDYNLDLSHRLKKELEKRGFRVVMTRSDDRFLSLSHRVAIANAQRNAIFISIHFNSSGTRSASGVETFALPPHGTAATHQTKLSSLMNGNVQDAENIAFATAVHAHVVDALGQNDRGIKRGSFQVLRGINKPAILYEGGFLTNPTEATKIHNPDHRQTTAETIAVAVDKFKTAMGKP